MRFDREEREGGGSAFYIRNCYKIQSVDLPSSSTYKSHSEINAVLVTKQGNRNLIFCVVYCPPDQVNDSFMKYFENCCLEMSKFNAEKIIVGDFNVDLLVKSANSFKLFSITREFDLKQQVTFPTRIANYMYENKTKIVQTKTLLDHIYTDARDKYTCGGFPFAGSDHHLVFLVKKMQSKPTWTSFTI